MTSGGSRVVDLEDLFNPEEQRRFRRLCLDTSAEELVELAESVEFHLLQVKEMAGPQTDVDTAELIATSLSEVLGSGLTFADDERALLRGAAEYFLLTDDANSDLTDPVGFDDDARVMNAVFDRLQLPEFKVRPAS